MAERLLAALEDGRAAGITARLELALDLAPESAEATEHLSGVQVVVFGHEQQGMALDAPAFGSRLDFQEQVPEASERFGTAGSFGNAYFDSATFVEEEDET